MNAIVVTDHGAMYGALEFYTKAKKAGLRAVHRRDRPTFSWR
ncbi:PHP domain-containing protein [Candidatus Electronema sp. JC]